MNINYLPFKQLKFCGFYLLFLINIQNFLEFFKLSTFFVFRPRFSAAVSMSRIFLYFRIIFFFSFHSRSVYFCIGVCKICVYFSVDVYVYFYFFTIFFSYIFLLSSSFSCTVYSQRVEKNFFMIFFFLLLSLLFTLHSSAAKCENFFRNYTIFILDWVNGK